MATLLDELEIIDRALRGGEATKEQKARGRELAALADAAPELREALEYFYNVMSDYHASVRKGYIERAMYRARTALLKTKGGSI